MRRRPWPAVAAWALWGLAVLGVATVPWFDHLLRQAHRPELTQLNASTVPAVVAALVAATVGAVLAGRRPRHPVGWLLLALGLSVTASGVVDGYARYGLLARPGALRPRRPPACWRWGSGPDWWSPPTSRSSTRSRSPPWPARCGSRSPRRSWSRPEASRSGPGRWWCASAAPAGPSASSFAGWRSRPP